jgi:hypothetical protein
MKYFIPFLFFILISCSNKVTQQNLHNLNGYWDIDKVESVDKIVTEYGANSTIDYYFVNDENQGFRKKTTLDFSGTYKTNNIKDKIVIEDKNGTFIIKTTTPLDNWEDVIINLTPEKLVLKNEKGILFHYNKHEKFNSN